MSCRFPARIPTLPGNLVDLRELAEEDVPAWFERASDPESSALSGDAIPESMDAGRQWLQIHRDRFRDRQGIRWAIVPKTQSGSVGTIGLNVSDPEQGVAELGAVIGRAFWRKGLGTCAARLVIAYAFEVMGLEEIRADVLHSNVAARRVLEKLGFGLVSDSPSNEHPMGRCSVFNLTVRRVCS